MHIHLFSCFIILICTPLSTSLAAPPAVISNPTEIKCIHRLRDPSHPNTRHYNAPFPTHCRKLAENLRLFPDSTTPMVFDRRPGWPTLPRIRHPYKMVYETCQARFMPRTEPASTTDPIFSTYGLFSLTIEVMVRGCLDVRPGQESKDDVASSVNYQRDFSPSQRANFTAVIYGFSVPNQAGPANVTAEEGGPDDADTAEAWASLNGSANGFVGGQSGSAEQGWLDVT